MSGGVHVENSECASLGAQRERMLRDGPLAGPSLQDRSRRKPRYAWQRSFGTLSPVTPDPYHELETKYLFGFTEGADIGAEGEQSVEFPNTHRVGRRAATTPRSERDEVDHMRTRLRRTAATNPCPHALGLRDPRGQWTSPTLIASISADCPPNSAIPRIGEGILVAADRIDTGRGAQEFLASTTVRQQLTEFSTNFLAIADTELIPNRLVRGRQPDPTRPDLARPPGEASGKRTADVGRESTALAYRFTCRKSRPAAERPSIPAACDRFGRTGLQGQALYIGPTFHVQFTGQIMLSAAFSTLGRRRHAVGGTQRPRPHQFSAPASRQTSKSGIRVSTATGLEEWTKMRIMKMLHHDDLRLILALAAAGSCIGSTALGGRSRRP